MRTHLDDLIIGHLYGFAHRLFFLRLDAYTVAAAGQPYIDRYVFISHGYTVLVLGCDRRVCTRRFWKNSSTSTPTEMAASAILNTGSKNTNSLPPTKGIQ